MKLQVTTLLAFIISLLKAGTKDTLTLGEVVKIEQAATNVHDYESPFIDLKYRTGDKLSDALYEYSSVYLKKYGSGQLASLAVRGTSASQTEVQWNGIKLNMPNLGQVDLSLFTIGVQDELQLVRSGTQGTIGGTLKMNNTVKIDSGFSVAGTFRAGSFNTYEGLADVQYSKGRFAGATKVSYLSAKNDFSYRNMFEAGNPLRIEANAAVQQFSALQQVSGKLNEHNDLHFFFWLTEAHRQIPPVMSKPNSNEIQDDRSVRVMGNWNGRINLLKLQFTSAYLYDAIHYKNPESHIDAPSFTHAFRNSFSASYYFPINLTWKTELHYDYESAADSNFTGLKSRNTLSLRSYADYYLLGKLRFHAGFRQDLVDKKLSAFAPEFSLNYLQNFSKGHSFSAGFIASRNFRFPTLNDLYWTPGGNPNLKQERSLNGEIQARYAWNKKVEVAVSNFYIYVQDWIQWIPQGTLWMPVNFKRVFSRGFEASLRLTNANENRPKQLAVHFNASYTYTRTTSLDAASEYDLSKGMQLIYVPVHSALAELQLQYRRFYLRSVNTYTGAVFISTDNTQGLNGYFISDIEVGKDFVFNNVQAGCSFRVNNVGGVQYQVVAQRPMPGRNVEATLRFKLL